MIDVNKNTIKPILSRLLLPLASILLLLVVGATTILLLNQRQNTAQSSQYLLKEVVNSIDISLAQQAKMITALEDGLLQNPGLSQALQAKDREQLRSLFSQPFQDFSQKYGITHFYFHCPDKVNLLRIHKPEKHGDLIQRFTLDEAKRSGKTAGGLELGPLGTFTLRIVQPVYAEDELIGFLELGKEIEGILLSLQQEFGVELAVAINKDTLEQKTWESGMEMLDREASWERYKEMVLIYYTKALFPAQLEPLIHGNKVHKHGDIEMETTFDEKAWQLIIHPLKDASNTIVGDLIILRDMTAVKAGFTRLVTLTAVGALFLVGAVLIFYYIILRRTDLQIITQHEKIRKSDAKLWSLVESSNDWIWEASIKGIFTYASPQVEAILGYKPEEIVGKTPFDFMHKEEAQRVTNLFNELIETSRPLIDLENVSLHKNGQQVIIETSGAPYFDEDGKVGSYIGINRDISKRKQSEKALIRLSTAIEQSSETVMITDDKGVIQYVNPAFEKLTGYSGAEALGQRTDILSSGKHDPEFYKEMWDTILQGKTWHGRLINKKKDGTLFEEESTISPVTDTNNQITNFVAVNRDVSKEISLENQLRQSIKMQAVGTMAGGFAHDFNNILASILGYSEFIQQEAPEESPIGKDINQVITAAKRAADLVKQILTFSRQSASTEMVLLPHLVVKEALNMLRATLPATLEIKEAIDSDCGTILADPTVIKQITVNLCTNGLQAMTNQKGVLRVGLQRQELNAAQIGNKKNVSPGSFIVLSVSDSGSGMDKTTIDRIFEPYFTTKQLERGTGLGLAVVHGAVETCKGFIEVESSIDKGSVFSVYFPAVQDDAAQNISAPLQRQEETRPSAKRILVVDDEPLLVKISNKKLTGRGYQVSAFTDSKAALEAFRNEPNSFDLLITDQTMPGLTGAELARAVLEINPSLPIIMCTGHSDIVSDKKAQNMGIKRFVFKPMFGDDLFDAVEEVFAEDEKAHTTASQSQED